MFEIIAQVLATNEWTMNVRIRVHHTLLGLKNLTKVENVGMSTATIIFILSEHRAIFTHKRRLYQKQKIQVPAKQIYTEQIADKVKLEWLFRLRSNQGFGPDEFFREQQKINTMLMWLKPKSLKFLFFVRKVLGSRLFIELRSNIMTCTPNILVRRSPEFL